MPDLLVSVVIPTDGRRPELFRQAFDSVYRQLYGRGEVLVQDNGDLWAGIDSLPGLHASYERNPTDLGLYGSVNAAIARARGQWVHVLPDDDFVAPGFYDAITFHAAVTPDAGAIVAACSVIDPDGSTRDGPGCETLHAGVMSGVEALLRHSNPFNLASVVFRRDAYDAVGPFRTDLEFADWEFWLRLARDYKFVFAASARAYFRLHDGQSWRQAGRYAAAKRECLMAAGVVDG